MATKTKSSKRKATPKVVDVKPQEVVKSTKPRFGLSRKYMTFLLILVLAGALYLFRGLFVAATVNGYPISRLQIIKALENESGERVLENLVTKELVNQEAKKKGLTVSGEEVQKQIDEIKASLETQGTTLEAALEMQGQTVEDLESNIELQKLAEKLLEDKTGVTEDEMKKYFDENKDSFGESAKYEDVKAQIETQLKAQKFQTEVEKYLTDLKAQYKVNYFVSY